MQKAKAKQTASADLSRTDKVNHSKAVKAIDDLSGAFLSLMDMGKFFDLNCDGPLPTGYTLSYTVGALCREMDKALLDVDTLLTGADRNVAVGKAERHIEQARWYLGSLTDLLEELSHTSDDWKEESLTGAVGDMVYTMALQAAREAELAALALGSGPGAGFTSPDYRLA